MRAADDSSTSHFASQHVTSDHLLRSRRWEWLLDLRKRLHVGVQIVDVKGDAVLPAGDGGASVALSRALVAQAPPVRAAIANAIQSRSPHAVVIETLLAQCLPLVLGRSVVGALIAARETLGGAAEVERTRGELELIGSTLRGAAEAHLTGEPPADDGTDLERVASLAQLLDGSPEGHADREMLEAFAEALAVWHDIELRAYVETGKDEYVLDVALPGARADAPLRLSPGEDVAPEGLVPLTADADRFGLTTSGDTLMARVPSGRGGWLLLLSNPPDLKVEAHLAVYLQILRDRLRVRAAEATSRLALAIGEPLLASDQRLDVAAAHAVDILKREVGTVDVLLRMASAAGAPLIVAGEGEMVGDRVADGGHMVLTRRATNQPTVTLAVARQDARPLTALQRELVETAADVFQAWSVRAGSGRRGERRRVPAAVDAMLDRFAGQSAEHGVNVSAVVVSSPQAVFRPGLARTWMAQARAAVRASDVVGLLGEGEVAFLLHDTAAEEARVAATRFSRLLAGDDPLIAQTLKVGFATRVPGLVAAGSIVEEARANAADARWLAGETSH